MATDRKTRLQEFVGWSATHITGDEKGEAQIFLDRLLQAFSQKGVLETGKAEFRIRKPKEDGGGTAFADFVWKPLVLIEMKKRGADLARHYRQAFDYWTRLVPGRPNYVVLCNFDEFWVYDFDVQLDEPLDKLKIEELPERFGPLAFLFPTEEKPVFRNNQEEVTRSAADRLAALFSKLNARTDVDRETAQRFVLQCLIALFAEDIGLLDDYMFTRIIDECDPPKKAYDLIGGLFVEMNTPGRTAGGRFKGVDYFNGGIFEKPARVELFSDELNQLKKAAEQKWSNVRPEIFGTIFQHSVDSEERRAFGAHFTSAVDIMKVIKPTISEPWEQLIDRAKTQAELAQLHERMQHFRVLDPACGSGNFLYLAYRELKRLEMKLFEREDELSKGKGKKARRISFVTARQFYGVDIIPFAVELAKVTMMIARKLAIDELHVDERALPFDDLNANFITGDALITIPENGEPYKTPWPEADVIIGNPPFIGAKLLKPQRGPDYVNAVRKLYPEVPGMADYCVYWFRRAHEHLPLCTPDDPVAGRAGLVGTQNIRNNKSREGGLDFIVQGGTIVEAVDNQPWSGEANVHVSIANWVKHAPINGRLTEREKSVVREQTLIPEAPKLWFKIDLKNKPFELRNRPSGPKHKVYELDFRESSRINAALSDTTDVTTAKVLDCNRSPKVVYQGVTHGHQGFILTPTERTELLRRDSESAGVIFPYLLGKKLVTGSGGPDRFVIDFQDMDLIEAQKYAGAIDRVEKTVLPTRRLALEKGKTAEGKQRSHHRKFLDHWWQLSWNRSDMFAALAPLKGRFIGLSRNTTYPIFAFIATNIRPSDVVQVFIFDDDYSFGLLQSQLHVIWALTKGSNRGTGPRYTPESVFDTFPWPQSAGITNVQSVANAGREVRRVRDKALTKVKGGLRAVYRLLELPGQNPLKDAHAALDAAVLAAYGFSAKKDLLQQLLDLNLEVAARIDRNEPVTAPGIPPDFPNPKSLITDDCIRSAM